MENGYVSMNLTVMSQKRTDRWAVRVPAFGFTVYGKTEEEAKQKNRDAVTALLQSFSAQDEVEAFLQSRGVSYTINDVTMREMPTNEDWFEEPRFAMGVALAGAR